MNYRLIIVALLLPLMSIAQRTNKAEVRWGDELSDKNDGFVLFNVGEHGGDAIHLMRKKKETFLARMDAEQKILATQEVDYEVNDDVSVGIEDQFVFAERILRFGSHFDKKNDKKTLYVKAFDARTLEVLVDWKKIAELDAERRRNQGGFDIKSSPSDEKLLIQFFLPYEKGAPEKTAFRVLNKDLTLDWKDEIALEYADEDFGYSDFEVDDDGSVLVLGKVNEFTARESRQMEKNEKSPYQYHLLVFDKSSDGIAKDYVLKLGDKFLQEMHLTIPKNENQIICTGFYSENGLWSIRGSYYMKLNRTTKEVISSTYHAFEDDFITMYMTEKQEKKASKKANRKGDELEMSDIEVREVLILDGGSIIVISEQYDFWITTVTTTDANGNMRTRNVFHYLYRDIIVQRFDEDGKLKWKSRVPKNQYTTNDGGRYSGYSLGLKGDNIYLIFNDSEANLGFSKGDELKRMRLGKKDAIITLVTMDDNSGQFSRESLDEVEKKDLICVPEKSVILNDKLLMVAEWRKKNRFGTVTFK